MQKRDCCTALKIGLALAATVGLGACALFGGRYDPPPAATPPVPSNVMSLYQGSQWDGANRAAFYTQDQGSRIMPLAWFHALRLSDNTELTADGLARFGYLSNPDSPAGLPVGFTTGTWQKIEYVGMTCAACHTRQIRASGKYYRVDGGPALSNLQGLFAEMDAAMQRALASGANFSVFAAGVLGKDASSAAVAQLRVDVETWAGPYHTLMARALPADHAWGVGRADAVGMILNRLGGVDIGTGPDHVIAGNIQVADAPTRYPFLWNASLQDKTQWPGFAPNGNDLFGLVRNLGEVYGVFGVFHPQPRPGWVGGIDYVSADQVNSANFTGLDRLEQVVRRIGSPVWPWSVDQDLAAKGKVLFSRAGGNKVSCASCHAIQEQHPGLFLPVTWKTPTQDVQTDSHEYGTLNWQGDSGVMEGSFVLLPFSPVKHRDAMVTILSTAVAGAIVQKAGLGRNPFSPSLSIITKDPGKNETLVVNASEAPPPTTSSFKYESRVLQGIWAVAPYLHNGSVPTLADLLEPCDKRPASFVIGIDYDTKDKVGLAVNQSGPVSSRIDTTSALATRGSGNFRCGHDGPGFGTDWQPEEKRAMVEYLKIL